jgi:hypothetical protein
MKKKNPLRREMQIARRKNITKVKPSGKVYSRQKNKQL